MSNFNNLTPEETERLALLVEECAEVQQIAMKILRHGYESCNPYEPEQKTNRFELQKEIGHLYFAIDFMAQKSDINQASCCVSQARKEDTIQQWLHHNKV